jgi:hypothetical protein
MGHGSSDMEQQNQVNGEERKYKSFAARSGNNNPNFRKNLQTNATVAYCQNHLIDDGTIL